MTYKSALRYEGKFGTLYGPLVDEVAVGQWLCNSIML